MRQGIASPLLDVRILSRTRGRAPENATATIDQRVPENQRTYSRRGRLGPDGPGSPSGPHREARTSRTGDDVAMPADRLIDEFEARLREVELVVGMRVMASWAEARKLLVEEARVLLVMATTTGERTAVHLGDLSGLDVEAVYPVLGQLKGRGLVIEEQRSYRLTDSGDESIAALDAARREGIASYLAHLGEDERRRLEVAFGADRPD